jgi:hypothetical protein
VWQYFEPVPPEKARRPVLMSLYRYPESWLERGVLGATR